MLGLFVFRTQSGIFFSQNDVLHQDLPLLSRTTREKTVFFEAIGADLAG
jgi:hypothetical protein